MVRGEVVIVQWKDTVKDRKRSFFKLLTSYRKGVGVIVLVCGLFWLALYLLCRFVVTVPEIQKVLDRVFRLGLYVIIAGPLVVPFVALASLFDSCVFKITETGVSRGNGDSRRIRKWDEIEGYCLREAREVDEPDCLVLNSSKDRPPFVLKLPEGELRERVIQEIALRVPAAESEKLYEPPMSKSDIVRMGVFTLVVSFGLGILVGLSQWKVSDIKPWCELLFVVLLLLGPATMWMVVFKGREIITRRALAVFGCLFSFACFFNMCGLCVLAVVLAIFRVQEVVNG